MLFNSVSFLLFFTCVCTLYFLIPHRLRWMLLLGSSYYFYMCWNPAYLLLIVASTLVDYYAGLRMGECADKVSRRKYLILSLLTNLGLLFAFKYYNFFNESWRALFAQTNLFYEMPHFDVLLPVGISFYTFQTLSYSIDVYRGSKTPEKHLGIFALYVSFFPQLVAGPIERSTRLLPQLTKKISFDEQRVTEGLRLILWGMFKKVVIADRLALFVDAVYNDPAAYDGRILIIATIFFAYQIYCDFSGYSDIAIGSAKILGFDLMDNFRRPYFAKSIPEFWKRWHISLSTWFKDYLYIPLGGNRVSPPRWMWNILVVFVLSGLWHGANGTFVMWGLLHGVFYVLYVKTESLRESLARVTGLIRFPRLHHMFQVVATFAWVCLAWIFFRANTLADAWGIVSRLGEGWRDPWIFASATEAWSSVPVSVTQFFASLTLIVILELVHALQERKIASNFFVQRPMVYRWAVYFVLCLLIMNAGVVEEVPFIYFQF